MLSAMKKLFSNNFTPHVSTDLNKRIEINLEIAKIEFLTPKHQIPEIEEIQITNANLKDEKIAENQIDSGLLLLKMAWPLKLPFFSKSHAGLIIMTCQAVWIKKNIENETCFRKDLFESVILRSLYFDFGPASGTDQEYVSPMHWRPMEINGAEWIYCESHKTTRYANENLQYCHFFAPVSNSIYLAISFYINDSTSSRIGNRKMKDLMKKVMLNSNLHLSNSSIAEKFSAEQQWPSLQYSPQRSPEAWDYPKGDRENMTIEERIAASKTPPPELNH